MAAKKKTATKKAAAKKTAAKKPAAKKTVAKKATGPRAGGACAKVWEIADRMKDAPRADVVAACVKAGINVNTAKQYQRWSKA